MSLAGLHPPRPAHARRTRARTAALLATLALLPACQRGGGGGELWIGLAAPMTDGQGKPDIYGVRSRQGAQLALEEVNQRRIHGRTLRMRLVDDRGDANVGLAVADSLVNDARILAVVGHVYSGVTLKAAENYSGKLAAVATTATSPEISKLDEWIFRMASSDSANSVALAGAVRGMGGRVAVIYANDEYGRGLAQPFAAALRQAGGVTAYNPMMDSTADVTPYLMRMRAYGSDLVFVATLQDAAARVIRQAHGLGMAPRFVGGDGLEGLVGMGPEFNGTTVGVLFHADASPRARDFAQRFRRKYGDDPDSAAALAYDAVLLLAGCMERGSLDREAVRACLERTGSGDRHPAFEGVGGRVAFDANGDPRDKQIAVGVIQDGRIVLQGRGQ
ncbi:MAG TPA: branched-chain amino acid ABC transporter substrate-binding protein [Longimicrobium sp.]|nr:branched-chain amino acid ABC transporter substrate-binding protein [Longimicrobium sp.]